MSAGLAVLIAATAVLPATAAGVVRWRRRVPLSPQERYQRDVRGIHLSIYRKGEDRHSRQFGDPPESSGLGGGWM